MFNFSGSHRSQGHFFLRNFFQNINMIALSWFISMEFHHVFFETIILLFMNSSQNFQHTSIWTFLKTILFIQVPKQNKLQTQNIQIIIFEIHKEKESDHSCQKLFNWSSVNYFHCPWATANDVNRRNKS